MLIDIGCPAIDRTYTGFDSYTFICKTNPANASGKITSIEIYLGSYANTLYVGIFHLISTNHFSTRSYQYLGTGIIPGYYQFDVDLDVEEGDFIGFYSTGNIDWDGSGGSGLWSVDFLAMPCENQEFTPNTSWPNLLISLYGTGETPPIIIKDSARTGIYSFKTLK